MHINCSYYLSLLSIVKFLQLILITIDIIDLEINTVNGRNIVG
jgi:hypothetical protein